MQLRWDSVSLPLVSSRYVFLPPLPFHLHFLLILIRCSRRWSRYVTLTDTGSEKRDMCLSLGAEKFIDFSQSADIVADVIATCDGLGAHAALITTASVCPFPRCNF